MNVTITITKATVLDEVGRLTNYAGSKMEGDDSTFQRVSTTNSDAQMLGQFWQSACDGATEALKRFIQSLTTTTNYVVVLDVSSSYDTSLTGSITTNLQNYMTLHIVSRWYRLANMKEADSYALQAAAQLDEAMSKIFYKKKPTRRSIHNNPN